MVGQHFDAEVNNVGWPASSNLEIFLRTLREMQSTHYDLIIVQWTTLQRHWFEPELNQRYMTVGSSETIDEPWQGHSIYLSKSRRREFLDTITMLTGDYKAVLDLLTFCQALIDLKQPNQRLVFVDGLLPWTSDLAELNDPDDLKGSMSEFTQNMLEFERNPDSEIRIFYQNLHEKLVPTLGYWANIFNNWKSNTVDIATEGHHPGVKSHQWMADQVITYLVDDK